MKKTLKTQIKTAAALACMGMFTMAIVQSGNAQNLFTDPGFEGQVTAPNPNPTGIPGWANFGGAQFSTTYAHSGSWSLYTPDNGGGYSVPGTYQVFAATPGETFTMSGWVYTPNVLPVNGNDFAIFQLSFFTGAPPNNYAGGTGTGTFGVNIGQPAGGGGVPLPQGAWTFASITGTAPAGTASLGAYILDINADANADFYFDDMSLTVPEPGTLSLCALGLAGLVGFRFRRKV
jgi:PEP-CTERM motif-containing protein